MSDCSEPEVEPEPKTEPRKGRPRGLQDATKRVRRTAQEISDDKIKIAQMRLDALRESEERKLANKKTRKPRVKAAAVEEASLPKARPPVRDESPPTPRVSSGNRREALYNSWFPSSPHTRY